LACCWIFTVSSSAVLSQFSQRYCMDLMRPPTVARMATSTGVVTVLATPTQLSAAMMPRPRMKIAAKFAGPFVGQRAEGFVGIP